MSPSATHASMRAERMHSLLASNSSAKFAKETTVRKTYIIWIGEREVGRYFRVDGYAKAIRKMKKDDQLVIQNGTLGVDYIVEVLRL